MTWMDIYIDQGVTYYNDKPLHRGLTSDTCGDCCLFYLFHRASNVDLNTVQSKFRAHDSQWNDTQVAEFAHKYVQSLIRVKIKSTLFQSEQQTCKYIKYC